MSEDKALMVVNRPQLTPQVWQMISEVAPTMFLARCFGVASKEQAAAIMLKGYEVGFSLSGSFEFIHVVEGKPSINPRGALALIQGSPLCAGMQVVDMQDDRGAPSGCRVWMKRVNGFEYAVTWTMEDAKKAGVVKSGSGWDKYPANMLRWRAIGFCADVVFPDITGGMKRADEYGADLTPDGDVIEGTWTTAPTQVTPGASPATTQATTTPPAPTGGDNDHDKPAATPVPGDGSRGSLLNEVEDGRLRLFEINTSYTPMWLKGHIKRHFGIDGAASALSDGQLQHLIWYCREALKLSLDKSLDDAGRKAAGKALSDAYDNRIAGRAMPDGIENAEPAAPPAGQMPPAAKPVPAQAMMPF